MRVLTTMVRATASSLRTKRRPAAPLGVSRAGASVRATRMDWRVDVSPWSCTVSRASRRRPPETRKGPAEPAGPFCACGGPLRTALSGGVWGADGGGYRCVGLRKWWGKTPHDCADDLRVMRTRERSCSFIVVCFYHVLRALCLRELAVLAPCNLSLLRTCGPSEPRRPQNR